MVQSSIKERRFQKLYRQAVIGREKEKENLAKELHDGVCQDFACIKIDLEGILSKIKRRQSRLAPRALQSLPLDLELVVSDLRESIRKLRLFMEELSSPEMESSNLEEALRRYVQRVSRKYRLKTHFYIQKDVLQLKRDEEIAFFRIVQEAVQNIVKHARATMVWIDISILGDRLILAIKDDGKGFLLSRKTKRKMADSYGLCYMQERCAFLKGRFIITSKKGKGTNILVSIPRVPGPEQ